MIINCARTLYTAKWKCEVTQYLVDSHMSSFWIHRSYLGMTVDYVKRKKKCTTGDKISETNVNER